jgi:hypothetical protein
MAAPVFQKCLLHHHFPTDHRESWCYYSQAFTWPLFSTYLQRTTIKLFLNNYHRSVKIPERDGLYLRPNMYCAPFSKHTISLHLSARLSGNSTMRCRPSSQGRNLPNRCRHLLHRAIVAYSEQWRTGRCKRSGGGRRRAGHKRVCFRFNEIRLLNSCCTTMVCLSRRGGHCSRTTLE